MNDAIIAHNQEDIDHISSRLPLASDRSINDPAYLIKSKDVFAMIGATKEFETIEKFENYRITRHSQIYQSIWNKQFLSLITIAAKNNGWNSVTQYGGQILLVADLWLNVNPVDQKSKNT